jgi:hypothetical protein
MCAVPRRVFTAKPSLARSSIAILSVMFLVLMGSFHISSHASELWSWGSLRTAGMSLMAATTGHSHGGGIPPWQQKTRPSITAAKGMVSKTSLMALKTKGPNLSPNFSLHSLEQTVGVSIVNRGSRRLLESPLELDSLDFVISPQHKHFSGALEFVGEEITDDLEAEQAPIDVVSEEEKVTRAQGGPHVPQDLLEVQQVGEVAVEVS